MIFFNMNGIIAPEKAEMIGYEICSFFQSFATPQKNAFLTV